MKAEVRWVDDARSVLHCTFSGNWEWKVFYETVEAPTIFNEPNHPCLLVDVRGIQRMPIDMVLHMKRAAQMVSKMEGLVVIIATSVGAATMYQMLTVVYKPLAEKMRLVTSEAEAFALLGIAV